MKDATISSCLLWFSCKPCIISISFSPCFSIDSMLLLSEVASSSSPSLGIFLFVALFRSFLALLGWFTVLDDSPLLVPFVPLVLGCGLGVPELLPGATESSVLGEVGFGIGESVRVPTSTTCLRVRTSLVPRTRSILSWRFFFLIGFHFEFCSRFLHPYIYRKGIWFSSGIFLLSRSLDISLATLS